MKYFPPVHITQGVFFASAETRRGREEAEKVRCSSAEACDQLDEALELPRKESTSGDGCPDSVNIGSPVFGQKAERPGMRINLAPGALPASI